MNNWQRVTIGEIAQVGRGSSPRPINNSEYFEDGTIPWVKIADATSSGKYLTKTKQYVNDYGASFSRKLEKGSLILATSGTLGYVQLLGVEGCIHDGWLYLSDFKRTNPEFMYYLLKTKTNEFINSAYGAAIQNINTTILKNLEIHLPPMEVQKSILFQLKTLDDLIINNQKKISVLEKIAQNLYEKWFIHFKFPGYEDANFIQGKSGKIPKEWQIVRLGQVVNLNYKTTKEINQNDVIKYIDIGSVSTGAINNFTEIEFKNAPSRARRTVSHGDIIIATVRPNRRSFALIIEPELKTIVSTGFVVVSPQKIPFSYCYLLLTQQSYTDYLSNNAGGAAYPAVSVKDFSRSKVIIPNLELLDKFHRIVKPLLLLKENLLSKNKVLEQTRDLLIPKLISGEIEV